MISDYLFQKASARKVPLSGTFELSPVCNFACKMCYVRKTPGQLREEGKTLIPWRDWLDLAEQCRGAGTLYLLLTGGEPFLYPGFRELYERLHAMGFLLSINTNGTLLDEETVAWLKKAAPQRVNVTLYGASPETYGRICGDPAGCDRAVRAIRLLKQAGIPTLINASMIPENAADLEAIAAFGRELELNTRIATYMFPPMRREREETDSRFTPEESAQIFMRRARCTLSEEDYQKFLRSRENERAQEVENWGDGPEFMRCRAGRSTFWVNWEGTMTACGMLDFPLKTYPFRESFGDCWAALTQAVRSTPVLAGCAGCDRRDICHVCVAMIHAETGTVDQKAPYLCRMTEETVALMRAEQRKVR